MRTIAASLSAAQRKMRESDETIVALSSPAMIAPFPQYRSLGRNTFKNGFFPSVRFASLLSLCMRLYCKSACQCKACNTHCVRLDWWCLRVNECALECVHVCAPLVTLCGPIGEQTVQTQPVRSALLVYTLHSQHSQLTLFSFLPPVFLRLQLIVQPSCDSCWSCNIRQNEELGETMKLVKEEMFILHQL